jgi:hypothetical protein
VENPVMLPSEKKAQIASEDKKKLYSPLYKLTGKIIKRLEKLELHVPIHKIAWMEVRGEFDAKRHKHLREDIIDFLKITNEYRKIHWNIIKLARKKFEVEMTKDGSYAPDIKEYESLKNEIPDVLIKGGKKVWAQSYDSYLPRIRERSLKKKHKPRDGKKMYKAISDDLKDTISLLKSQQEESLNSARRFRRGLELMKSQPHRSWGYWTDSEFEAAEKGKGIKKNGKNFKIAGDDIKPGKKVVPEDNVKKMILEY